MTKVNFSAVIIAAVTAVVVSAVWYVSLSNQLVELGSAGGDASRSPVLTLAVELVRGLVLAAAVAELAARLGIATWKGAVSFGLVAWVAFPVILLSGSVFHENVPWKLAAIHAGDWLLKLVIMTVIVSVWPRKQRRAATRPVVRG